MVFIQACIDLGRCIKLVLLFSCFVCFAANLVAVVFHVCLLLLMLMSYAVAAAVAVVVIVGVVDCQLF